MGASWDDTLRELRGEFVRSSIARIERMRGMLAALQGDPTDTARCRELMLQFHGLAGAGTTYGFPEVTRLGLLGERLTGGKEKPAISDPSLLSTLADIVEDLRRDLEAGGASAASGPEPGAKQGEPAPVARPVVLLVEDDDDWRGRLRQRLEQEGYEVREARDRANGQAALDEALPDAVVFDVVLPDGDGRDLVAYVRGLPGGDDVAILMASVRADFQDKLEALKNGADGYFEKPLDWEALLRRLQHLLDRRLGPAPRVLCVEDAEEQAAFLRSVLGSAGYEVETLTDPRRFEDVLAEFRPDLVVMDILLPGLSGFDLTRYLRQDARFAPLPVLFLTGQGQADARIEALRVGGDDFILKPVSPGLLLAAVAAHVERGRLMRGLMERDGLTRLLTHSAFLERAREVYERALRRRSTQPPLLLMLDLDAFKSVNDRFGYAAGDRVLAAFSALLRRHLRNSDAIGRYGGEEFAVLLERLGEADALGLATRLREGLAAMEQRAHDGSSFELTVSGGLAALDLQVMSFDEWIKAADDALDAAKEQGRNRVVLASVAGGSEQG